MDSGSTRRTLERMGTSVVPVRNGDAEVRRRERIVGAVNRQAAREHERRRGRQLHFGLLVAAAVMGSVAMVTLGIVLNGSPVESSSGIEASIQRPALTEIVTIDGGACRVRSGDDERPARVGGELARGEHIITADGRAQLKMEELVDAQVSSHTELGVPEDHQVGLALELLRGKSAFSVAPLPHGQRFAVLTPNAEIVVHGTRFEVVVESNQGETVTTVRVWEGRVGVTSLGREWVLSAGQSWSSRADVATQELSRATHATERTNAAEPQGDDAPRSLARQARQGATSRSEPSQSSTLADETRAYMEAMALKRRGENARALARLEAFLRRYPESPLVENAQVERLRLLRALGEDDAAAEAARHYVREHPTGFARDEAEGSAAPGTSAQPSGG